MPNKPIIVIDPGHGGKEKVGGSSPNNAVGTNGLLEKNLTLDMANRVAASLAAGADVFLTRAGDTNLGLSERAKFAREKGAQVFLSLHFNGFKDESVDGTEVWVAKNASQASRDLAKTVLNKLVGAARLRDRGVREGDLGVILPTRHAANTSACLLEISFLTNPAQARELESDTYRQNIADSICEGVRQYLSSSGASRSLADERFDTTVLAEPTMDEIAAEIGVGSLSDYVSTVVKPAKLFGLSVGGGLHPDFYKKLQKAETEAALLIHPDGSPVTSSEWGITNIGGCQPRRRGWHPWGLAVDIDYLKNPYVMHEAGEPAMDALVAPVYQRISRFMLKRDSVVPKEMTETKKGEAKKDRVSRLYDSLKEESDAMKLYFKLMQDQTLLQKELNKHDLHDTTFWEKVWGVKDETPSLDSIQEIMMRDYVALSGQTGPAISGKSYPDPKKMFKGISGDAPFVGRKPENGFLAIRKEIVTAITNAGLRWGAIDFGAPSGDVMHFDDGWSGFASKILAAKTKLNPPKAKSKSFDYGEDHWGEQFEYTGRSFDDPAAATKPSVNRLFSELKDPPENHYEVRVSSVGAIKVTEGFLVDGPHSKKNGIKAILGDGTNYKVADGSTVNLGIDYVVKDSTKQVANWFGGEVADAIMSTTGYGNRVIVETNLTYNYEKKDYPVFTHYAHLDSISVKKGDKIKAGDYVGVMGDTGASKGAHVDQRFWIDTSSGRIDLSPNLLVNLVTPGLRFAEPLGKTYTVSDVKWAADNLSPDYRHLGAAIDTTAFDFTAASLARLCEANYFNVKSNPTDPRDEVIFALRGCQLDGGKESSGGFVSTVKLVEAVPDHQQSKCVMGVWKRSTNEVAVFSGSTVPFWENMEKFRACVEKNPTEWRKICSDLMTNMLATGRFLFTVGTHHDDSDKLRIPGAIRQQTDVPVIRTFDNLTYEVTDFWDFGNPGDNIHPSRHSTPTDPFSSQGCLTVPGGGTYMTRTTKHDKLWSEFRKAAGLTATSAPAGEDGFQFVVILLTGREARLFHTRSKKELTRLRFGSEGVDVQTLQLRLANIARKAAGTGNYYSGKQDGSMGMATVKAYVAWQQDNFGLADGIVTPAIAKSLSFDIVNHLCLKDPVPLPKSFSDEPKPRKLTTEEIDYYKKLAEKQNKGEIKGKTFVKRTFDEAIVWELPEKSDGYFIYNLNDLAGRKGYEDDKGLDEIGTKETIEKIIAIGKEWHKLHSDQPLQIGDISRPGGIDTPDHDTHTDGKTFDLRPLRKKNGTGGFTYTETAVYSADLTKEFIRLVRKLNPKTSFYFNDKAIYEDKEFKDFVTQKSGHDNHLHVMLP